MVYCGCRTCCNKLTWCTFVLFLLGSAVLLGVGLYKCVPCTTQLVRCVGDSQIKSQEVCWQSFWKCNNNGLFFILSIVGVAAFFVALLSCCCFLCARKPSHSKRKQDEQQYIAGGPMDAPATGGHDQATYPDQYAAYNPAAPVGTKPGSHYV